MRGEPHTPISVAGISAAAHPTTRMRVRSTVTRALMLATMTAGAASLVFEQSPANEVLRTNARLEALKRTGSPIAVGLLVAAITLVIEMVSALLITAALHQRGGAVQKLKQRMIRKACERQVSDPLTISLPGGSRFPVIVGSGWDGLFHLSFDGLGGVATGP